MATRAVVALVGAGLVGVATGASIRSEPQPSPTTLQVHRLEVVNDDGHVVDWLQATAGGAELVLGGESQVSLVSSPGVAAVNAVGTSGVARLVAAEAGHVVVLPISDDP